MSPLSTICTVLQCILSLFFQPAVNQLINNNNPIATSGYENLLKAYSPLFSYRSLNITFFEFFDSVIITMQNKILTRYIHL